MSLIDFTKALQRKSTNLLCPQGIVFHHVPKCGGTSAGRALRRAYFLSQGTVTPVESEQAFDIVRLAAGKQGFGHVSELREMMLLYHMYSDVRCIAAHVPFSAVAYEAFHAQYSFVTLLRDPVDRFVSHYHWGSRHGAHFAIAETFEEFLETKRAREMGSTYVRYFCGVTGDEFSADQADTAIANLRCMDCVGFLDDLPHFERDLRALSGRRIRLGWENATLGKAGKLKTLSEKVRAKVRELCAPDIAVWNAVQDLREPNTFSHPSPGGRHRALAGIGPAKDAR